MSKVKSLHWKLYESIYDGVGNKSERYSVVKEIVITVTAIVLAVTGN